MYTCTYVRRALFFYLSYFPPGPTRISSRQRFASPFFKGKKWRLAPPTLTQTRTSLFFFFFFFLLWILFGHRMLLRDPIFCTTYNQKRFPPVSLGPPLFPPPPTPSSLQSFNPRKRISDLMQWKSKKFLLYDNTKDISRFGIELSVPHDTKGRVTVGMSTASPAIELQSAVHREKSKLKSHPRLSACPAPSWRIFLSLTGCICIIPTYISWWRSQSFSFPFSFFFGSSLFVLGFFLFSFSPYNGLENISYGVEVISLLHNYLERYRVKGRCSHLRSPYRKPGPSKIPGIGICTYM